MAASGSNLFPVPVWFTPRSLTPEEQKLVKTQFESWVVYSDEMGKKAFENFEIFANIEALRSKLDSVAKSFDQLQADINVSSLTPVELSKKFKKLSQEDFTQLQALVEMRIEKKWTHIPSWDFLGSVFENGKTECVYHDLIHYKPSTFKGQKPGTENLYNTVKAKLETQILRVRSLAKSPLNTNQEITKQNSEYKALEARLESLKGQVQAKLRAKSQANAVSNANAVPAQQAVPVANGAKVSPVPVIPSITRLNDSPPSNSINSPSKGNGIIYVDGVEEKEQKEQKKHDSPSSLRLSGSQAGKIKPGVLAQSSVINEVNQANSKDKKAAVANKKVNENQNSGRSWLGCFSSH